MSPRKAAKATAKAVVKRSAAPVKPAAVARPAPAKAAAAAEGDMSAEATRLAQGIDRALKAGKLDALSQPAMQALMGALCRFYGAQVEGGKDYLPLSGRTVVSPTEIMTTTSGLLKAANLAVFELGMWQSWTGR